MFDLDTPRRLSILIVLVYAAIFFFAAPPGSPGIVVVRLFQIMGYFLLPLACIWYGDEMGEYVGTLPGPGINRPTPGWMVRLGGWFLLFLPVILVLFVCTFGKP